MVLAFSYRLSKMWVWFSVLAISRVIMCEAKGISAELPSIKVRQANSDVIARVYDNHFEEYVKHKLDDVPCYMAAAGEAGEKWQFQIDMLTKLAVKAVLEDGEDVNAAIHCPHPSGCSDFEDEEYCGCPPLYLGVVWEELELVQRALKRGADMSISCCNNDTRPLFLLSDNWDIIKLIIHEGADINVRNEEGETLLHKLVRHKIVPTTETLDEILRFLLIRGIDINAKNCDDETALLIASDGLDDTEYNSEKEEEFREGENKLAKFLLINGADVQARDKNNWTSLHIASHHCNIGLARILIEAGADVNAKTSEDQTPLLIAVSINVFLEFGDKSNRAEERDLLRDYRFMCNTDLCFKMKKLYRRKLSTTALLIDAGAELDVKQEDDWTPLHIAVYYMDYEVTKLLVDSSADANARDVLGCTPLHLAVMRSNNISTLLVKNKAQVNSKQENGWTPLHLAVFYGNLDTVRMLIQNGADIDVKQHKGWTPWMIASRMDRTEIAELLADNGAETSLSSRILNTGRHLWEFISDKRKSDVDFLSDMLAYDGLVGLWKCKTSYSELFDK